MVSKIEKQRAELQQALIETGFKRSSRGAAWVNKRGRDNADIKIDIQKNNMKIFVKYENEKKWFKSGSEGISKLDPLGNPVGIRNYLKRIIQ